MGIKPNFANVDTESFQLSPDKEKDKIVLNIQEERSGGIILEKHQGGPFELTGNIFVDTYRKINRFLVSHAKVKSKEMANFYHLLSVMINAGIPMVRALRSFVNQVDKESRLEIIVENLANGIESGASLSESMLPYPDVFNEANIGMVRAGEASGQISSVLENLADDAEKAYMIKSKVKSAMTYPVVIFCLLIAVVVAMMVYVVPQLTELFTATSAELPLITKIVVGISDFFVNKKLTLIVAVVGMVVFFLLFRKTEVGNYQLDKLKLNLPIFGKLFQKAYLSRFARSLSNLLDSKVSIVRTLEITANSIGNEVYKRSLLLSAEDIKQGIPLADNLSSNKLFPPMLVNMVDVGEKTAQLDEIMRKVAHFYEEEVDTAVAGISKIIEPVILIVIGVTVGGVVAAIMLPIMKLADLAGSL